MRRSFFQNILDTIVDEDINLVFSPIGYFSGLLSRSIMIGSSQNKKAAKEILAMEKEGRLKITQPGLSKMAFLGLMEKHQLPLPPTWYISGKTMRFHGFNGKVSNISELAERYDNQESIYWVEKFSKMHNGDGVDIVTSDISQITKGSIYQELIKPPLGMRYIQDTRFLIVDGEIVKSYSRLPKEPIVDLSGNFLRHPPTRNQVLANIAQGGMVSEVPQEYYDVYSDLVIEAYKVLARESDFIMGSIDLLLGETPLLLEAHTSPGTKDHNKYKLAVKIYIEKESKGKKVILFEKSSLNDFLKKELGNKVALYI